MIDRHARDSRVPWVALGYLVLALVATWPLVLGLDRDVPGDLGDALLNMWILQWGAEHVPRLLTGATSWQVFWDGAIFHPEPRTLALSEHMVAQGLQAAPLLAVTGNVLLAYNLIFLSTFVLSALGAYLLARDLTGDWRAGVIAGLVFGFLPYRIAQVPHLQVLSSQWMPLALWGFHRFIRRGSRRALAGGTSALVLQHWSCGYYVLYFAPFVPIFALHEMWRASRLRDAPTWAGLMLAAAVTTALTVPFLLPYLDVQRLYGFERPRGEVLAFSANVWSYATASDSLRVWGDRLRLHRAPEGQTFLGFTAMLLALVAVGGAWGRAWRDARGEHETSGWRRRVVRLLGGVAALHALALGAVVLLGGVHLRLAGLSLRATSPLRPLVVAGMALAVAAVLSPRLRVALRRFAVHPAVAAIALMVLAIWLSLGPSPAAGADRIPGMGLYGLLYDHVPGFTGVRAPARYAMIAGLFLSIAAAFGIATLLQRRRAGPILAVCGGLIVAEGAAVPLPVNLTWGGAEAMPPARVYAAALAPPVYRRLAQLPSSSAIAEFPFGDPAWEIRYVYYATVHRRPILNGYSGAFPPAYQRRVAALRRFAEDGDTAWRALIDAGATHLVVHTAGYADATSARVLADWLESRGAVVMERFPDGDLLFALPRR